MSVLIKGMKMPSSCEKCRFSGFGGLRNERVVCMFTGANAYMNEVQYLDDCPLIPVPPHGRLIDADALMETFRERKRPTLSDGKDGSKERVRYLDFISTLQAIKDAPTIIPAEEGE